MGDQDQEKKVVITDEMIRAGVAAYRLELADDYRTVPCLEDTLKAVYQAMFDAAPH